MRSNRDEAAKALYDERRKLLAGLMMSEAEPWDELPEHVRERWRRKSENVDPSGGADEPGTRLEG